MDFSLSRWSGAGSDVDVQLTGADLGRLRAAADDVKRRLRKYAGVYEVTDTFRAGACRIAAVVSGRYSTSSTIASSRRSPCWRRPRNSSRRSS